MQLLIGLPLLSVSVSEMLAPARGLPLWSIDNVNSVAAPLADIVDPGFVVTSGIAAGGGDKTL